MKKSFTAQAALLFCDKHQNEEMDLYCKPCKKPICSKCVQTDHVGHDFETIAKWSRKLINNRVGFLNDLRSTFARKKKCNDRTVSETKCRNKNLLRKKLSSLEKKREEMHQAVDKLIDQQKKECKTNSENLSGDVQNLEKKMKEEEDAIMNMLDIFEKTTTKGLDIIEYYEKLCSRVNNMEMPIFCEHNDRQVYYEGDINDDQLKEIIGVVEESSSVPHIEDEVSHFSHKSVAVCNIRAISNDKAWVTYKDEKEFALMNTKGKCIQSVKNNTGRHSFFVTNDKSFIHFDYNKQLLLKIDLSGKTTKIKDTKPLYPLFVGEALDGNILVTLVDEDSLTRNAQSQRKVQMVMPGGKLLHTYEFGEDGSTPVLTKPCRPIQNYNSNVCVLNGYEVGADIYREKLVVFHEDGEFKFMYEGHGGEFNPQDICCDSLCNVICTNYRDNSVHIIDSDGTFLAYLLTSDTCLADPISLGLHSDALWVGSHSGEVAVYRYKY